MTALALIPFALAFTWRALEKRSPGSVALAAIFSAAVVSNNFYGATALTMFYAMVLWSFWVTRRNYRLAFVTPLENRVGRVATLVTLAVLLGLIVFGRRWERWV